MDVGDLIARADSPIPFVPPHGGNVGHAYDAGILPDLCRVMIAAGRRFPNESRLQKLAERAEVQLHGARHEASRAPIQTRPLPAWPYSTALISASARRRVW